jgi:CBS domain-containing protein
MWEHDIGCVPMIDDAGHVTGMLTDRDIAMAAYINGLRLSDINAETAQSKSTICCAPDDDVETVMRQMAANQIHRVPVVDREGMLTGILSLNDCAVAYGAGRRQIKARALSDTIARICSNSAQHSPQLTVAS